MICWFRCMITLSQDTQNPPTEDHWRIYLVSSTDIMHLNQHITHLSQIITHLSQIIIHQSQIIIHPSQTTTHLHPSTTSLSQRIMLPLQVLMFRTTPILLETTFPPWRRWPVILSVWRLFLALGCQNIT